MTGFVSVCMYECSYVCGSIGWMYVCVAGLIFDRLIVAFVIYVGDGGIYCGVSGSLLLFCSQMYSCDKCNFLCVIFDHLGN